MPARRTELLFALATGHLALAALGPAALGRSSGKPAGTATDFKFKILPARATAGAATFTVVNKRQATHDFKTAGKKTKILNPGQKATLVVRLKKGRYPYLCTVP